jgi:hypothetical protein
MAEGVQVLIVVTFGAVCFGCGALVGWILTRNKARRFWGAPRPAAKFAKARAANEFEQTTVARRRKQTNKSIKQTKQRKAS